MTKTEALQKVQEMEEFLEKQPGPGANSLAGEFFRERCRDLKIAVPFNTDCANVVNWAGIYYSSDKWERYGSDKVRQFLKKALARVKAKTTEYYKHYESWIAD